MKNFTLIPMASAILLSVLCGSCEAEADFEVFPLEPEFPAVPFGEVQHELETEA